VKLKRKDRDEAVIEPAPVNDVTLRAGSAKHASDTSPSSGSNLAAQAAAQATMVATESGLTDPAVPPVAADRSGQQLGDVLVLRGLVTHAQVQEALELQSKSGGRLGELLVQMGVLDERGLVDALAEFFGMPVADLRRYKPDPEALALVNEDVARKNMAIPISLHDDGLHVAVAEPSDALRFLLSEKSGHPVRLLLAPMSDVLWAIDSNYRAIGGVA
jgi:type IV pilus assembly protein PilB